MYQLLMVRHVTKLQPDIHQCCAMNFLQEIIANSSLFVYIASLMTWPSVLASLAAGLLLIVVRTVVKVGVSVALAKVSGITVRKGVWTGLALTPMSAYAILLLEQSREQGFSPAPEIMAAMAGMMLVQELLGPVVTQRALMAARETS